MSSADTGTAPATPAGGATPGTNNETTEEQTTNNAQNNNNTRNRSHGSGTANNFWISNFKGEVTEVGAVIGTKSENRNKDSMTMFQEKISSYVMREYKKGRDIVPLIKKIEDVDTTKWKPTTPTIPTGEKEVPAASMLEYKLLYNKFLSRKNQLADNKGSLYSLIKGQCTPALIAELKGLDDYNDKDADFDVLWLLTQVNLIVSGVEQRTQNTYELAFTLIRSLVNLRQQEHESIEAYMDHFRESVQTLEFAGLNVFNHPSLKKLELKKIMDQKGLDISAATTTETDQAEKASAECLKAVFMLENADPRRFLTLFTDLRKDMIKKRDNFPRTMVESFHMLNRWKVDRNTRGGTPGNQNRRRRIGHTYAQTNGPPAGTELVPGTDGTTANVLCYGCQQWGHIRPNCPNGRGRTGHTLMQYGICLMQRLDSADLYSDSGINKAWILLDSCSTLSCVCNPSLVTNVRPCDKSELMTVFTNGGQVEYNRVGVFSLFPFQVYFDERSMANILSLKDVASRFRVTMDTTVEHSMNVHVSNHQVLKFKQCGDGLHFLDTSTLGRSVFSSNSAVNGYSYLQTVTSNKEHFTRREVQGANAARNLQQLLWWPSTKTYSKAVISPYLRNCTVTPDNITRATTIHGPAIPPIKGKMVNTKPTLYTPIPRVDVPAPIIVEHRDLSLQMDLCYVNGSPFFHTITDDICYRTTHACKSRSRAQILTCIKKVQTKYYRRGFNIMDYHGDNEFLNIEDDLVPATLHVRAAGQHTEKAERSIRTIKERTRSMVHSTPYRRMPKLMIKMLMDGARTFLNYFPAEQGIQGNMTPAMIVDGKILNCANLKLQFGSYVQLYRSTDNTPKSRSVGAIALIPSNEQGGYWFMSLKTGHKLHGYHWVELPISDKVIDRVEELAEGQGQPLMDNGPISEWSPGDLIVDVDDDPEAMHDEMDEVEYPDDDDDEGQDPEAAPGAPRVTIVTDDEEVDEYAEDRSNNINEYEGEWTNEQEDEHEQDENNEYEERSESEEEESSKSRKDNVSINDQMSEQEDTDEEEAAELPQEDAEEPVANTRPRRNNAGSGVTRLKLSMSGKSHRDTKVQFTQVGSQREQQHIDWFTEIKDIAVNACFTQMSAREGIERFGQLAVAAMLKEYKQLDDLLVFGAVSPKSMSEQENRRALQAINLIKLKQCRKVKGRTCADGSVQRGYISKEDSSSPTISLQALFVTWIIDSIEGRKVQTFDVPGAYLHAEIPKEERVFMKFEKEFVDIMCEVNPEYKEHVRFENGKKVLYVQVLKAIYGMIESALRWYELFTSTLSGMGFTLNPYDKCVANKMINSNQCTVGWYVDDNKVSHVDDKVNTEIVDAIEEHFGKLARTTGNKHTFLGMDVEMIGKGKIAISTPQHVNKAIEGLGEHVNGTAVNPAKSKLFLIDHNSPKLAGAKKETFHSVTAKVLWISQRSRPDLDTAVSFLCTRVKEPTEEDWRKLRRVICYLKATKDDKRIIGMDSLWSLRTWIDGSYAVHNNMRGHTGGAMSLGWGVIHAKASKQKLNLKSSTETEVIAVSEYVPYKIWLINFMEEQGYKFKDKVLFQDNMSAMKMEKNSRNSCTGNSRHISIRFFFVKDRLDKKEFRLEYCPTGDMIADFFTKALQGALFNRFRAVIMGWEHINTIPTSTNKERVGESVFLDEDMNGKTSVKKSYADAVKKGSSHMSTEAKKHLSKNSD